MGAEAHLRSGTEKGAQKIFQRSFQVAHGNVRIHIQAFKLIEGGKVRGVNFVAAVGGTGSDDTHGRQLLSMERICTEDVCVRRSLPESK